MKNIDQVNRLIWEIDNYEHIEKYGSLQRGLFISYWMLIRYTLNLKVAALAGYDLSPPSVKKTSSWRYKVSFLLNAYQYRLKAKKADFLFISPSIGNIDDGEYVENIYHDLFAQYLIKQGKKVLILEQPNVAWRGFKKRKFNVPTYAITWSYLKRKLKSIFLSPFVRIKDDKINEFNLIINTIIKKHIPNNDTFVKEIKSHLLFNIKNIKFYIDMWEDVVKKCKPRAVMMQDICCGASAGIASLVFKHHHILVIEDQHGLIDIQDIQFNYGLKLKVNPHYNHFMPDYFLIYGKRWLQNMNIASHKIIIGNPYHAQAKEKYSNLSPCYDLLVITDSERPDFTYAKVKTLLASPYQILLRPHPRELSVAHERYRELLAFNNVTLDTDRDVYRSIQRAKIVICIVGSFISTVVWEALALNKPVLCYLNHFAALDHTYHTDFINFYDDDQKLLNAIDAILSEDKVFDFPFADFYALDWQKKFGKLVKQIL
ncbi:MAG: hypothetical protein H0W64_10480 [Gammaproteobacteria bacterium]|nr:hypothetical protein [Gammaproteobacteria bacterium]